MKFESTKITQDGNTTTEYRVNGEKVGFWKALPYMIAMLWISALVAMIFAPVLVAMFGIVTLMIGIALAIVVVAFVPAGLYRLITGVWPSWFQVEYGKTETVEDIAE